MNIRALRGLNDPLSVDNEPFYTFCRTLKRWTTGTLLGSIRDASGFLFLIFLYRRFRPWVSYCRVSYYQGGYLNIESTLQFSVRKCQMFTSHILIFGNIFDASRLWDPSRSTRIVKLYHIARNQLLGSSERRFWAILNILLWFSCFLGHFRWFSSFGTYPDRLARQTL